MKRLSRPLILGLILALFAVPTLSQAAASADPAPTTGPTVPHLALRDTDPEEAGEAEDEEEFEVEDCEGAEDIFEFEEEEFDEAEEEEFEVEVEECEEEAQKNKAGAVTAPEECRVRQAESSITALPDSNRIELTVRYLTYTPSTVSLDLKLKDGKGSLKIENATRHLGKKGVLHLSTKVSDAVMERAAKAKEFDVALRASKTPGACADMLEQHLQVKHPVGDARVYTPRVN
ncbi:MAG TPA: hypothetical protein VJL81_11825 [Solirubrobacterales bacterium]|nr:hypothetical protein [Solirubrobacterales bacterium]